MYKCSRCGEIFQDPDISSWEELHDELDGYWTETFYDESCPNCGSEDFDDYIDNDEVDEYD